MKTSTGPGIGKLMTYQCPAKLSVSPGQRSVVSPARQVAWQCTHGAAASTAPGVAERAVKTTQPTRVLRSGYRTSSWYATRSTNVSRARDLTWGSSRCWRQ
ncbi:hypothetical protein ElyMa_003162700 [Elysia marginata]|uniref:Ig-like domain-containing protein n=1 Tax=Elysia marginata TaxID=1093978 RepID=A0AAV4IWD6_9GAST|nr:hypothetical protein ElyMa_003162700 [Elysia marginata]